MNLDTVYLDNSLRQWLIAGVIAIAAVIVLAIIRRVAVQRLQKFAEQTSTQFDDLIAGILAATKGWFLAVVGIYAGTTALVLTDKLGERLNSVVALAVIVQGGLWVAAAAGFMIDRYRAERMEDDRGTATMMGALKYIVKGLIWIVVLLLALDNVGIDVTALITGLGVGGIAVALAVQNIFGDLLASLAIVFDRPFVLGDTIKVDDKMGNVEHIGLKTTRVRSLSGEQLVFSNADLLSSRVQNFGRMQERRIVFTLGVIYQTPRHLLEKIPGIIRAAIEADESLRFDRSHFSAYGAFSIDFETVYWVTVPDYPVYMDAQQKVYLRIHEAFEQEGIEFAYPSQTLFLERGTRALAVESMANAHGNGKATANA